MQTIVVLPHETVPGDVCSSVPCGPCAFSDPSRIRVLVQHQPTIAVDNEMTDACCDNYASVDVIW